MFPSGPHVVMVPLPYTLCSHPKTQKRGYQPGDHVTGTVRAHYFFGKPVDGAEISIKDSAMDVEVSEVASAQGKTDTDGSYRFDLHLPKYFAGRPLSHGAARVLIEATRSPPPSP